MRNAHAIQRIFSAPLPTQQLTTEQVVLWMNGHDIATSEHYDIYLT